MSTQNELSLNMIGFSQGESDALIEVFLKGRDLERTVFVDDDRSLLEAAESHFLGLRTVHVSNRMCSNRLRYH